MKLKDIGLIFLGISLGLNLTLGFVQVPFYWVGAILTIPFLVIGGLIVAYDIVKSSNHKEQSSEADKQ